MKIYPSVHKVNAKDKTNPFDIPLGYIETVPRSIDMRVNVMPDFVKKEDGAVVDIYQKFTTDKIIFFDERGKKADVELKRVGNEYMYNPPVTSFTPKEFSYRAVLRRTGTYRPGEVYKLKIGAIGADSLFSSLSAVLSSLPANIIINDGDISKQSLIHASVAESDFIFMSTNDGTGGVVIDGKTMTVSDMLETNCNVWMSVKSFGETMRAYKGVKENETPADLKKKILYDNLPNIDKYAHQFYTDQENAAYPFSKYEYVNIFNGTCPVLILHKKNKGYVVVSHENLFANLVKNFKLIHEILTYVHVNAYRHTKTRSSWISNDPVDYYLSRSSAFNQNHKTINLFRMIHDDIGEINTSLRLVDVLVDPGIKYVRLSANGLMFFEKTEGNDPKKPSAAFSLLSAAGNILFYTRIPVIQTVEDTVSVSYLPDGNIFTIDIAAYRSSSRMLDIPGASFSVSSLNEDAYVLCIFDSKWYLIPESNINDPAFQAYAGVATLSIIRDTIFRNYDIRVLGGGEAADITNYELIDSSNLMGRPYRVGSVSFVKIPKQYKKFAAELFNQLESNMSSGEYPVLVFE